MAEVKKNIIPEGLEPYFYAASIQEIANKGFDTDYVGDEDSIQFYRSEGCEYVGTIMAKDQYFDALDANNLLDVIWEYDGKLRAVTISAGRIMYVSLEEILNSVN